MDGWTDEGRKEGRKEWIDGWIFRKGQLCNQRLASSIDVASKQASKQASERARTQLITQVNSPKTSWGKAPSLRKGWCFADEPSPSP